MRTRIRYRFGLPVESRLEVGSLFHTAAGANFPGCGAAYLSQWRARDSGNKPLRTARRRAGLWGMLAGLSFRVFFPILLASQFALCQQSEGGAPPNGQVIFLQRCAKCHGEKGEGISALINIAGPSLKAEHDRGMVMAAMEVGPGHMPSFVYVLSVPEMQAAADYVTQQIAVVPLTGGNLSEGGELYRANCAACHRTAVRGGALVFTGVNAPALTGKSAAIVAGAIRWGPGPMPRFPASVLNDRQLASVVRYVRFVQNPPNPGGTPIGYFGPVAEGFIAWIAVFFLIGIAVWIERGAADERKR